MHVETYTHLTHFLWWKIQMCTHIARSHAAYMHATCICVHVDINMWTFKYHWPGHASVHNNPQTHIRKVHMYVSMSPHVDKYQSTCQDTRVPTQNPHTSDTCAHHACVCSHANTCGHTCIRLSEYDYAITNIYPQLHDTCKALRQMSSEHGP